MARIKRGVTALSNGPCDTTAPLVWFSYDIEPWSGHGRTNSQRFHFDSEEIKLVDGVGIKPVYGRPMLFTEALSDPHDRGAALLARNVGHYLAQVDVVRWAKLVLDDNQVALDILRQNVD
jgi:hypothetical protein